MLLLIAGFILGILLCRTLYVLWEINTGCPTKLNKSSVKTLVVLGSGGHTGEMLKIINRLDPVRYSPKVYVLAATDAVSLKRLYHIEGIQEEKESEKSYCIETIPRTREVGQSWLSTIVTTLWASIFCLSVIARHRPSLILTNGPGTCVPLCLSALLFRIFGISHCRIVFIESLCRVQSLSLTGLILYRLVDDFFVQWDKLKEKYPRAIFLGRLV
ncbi:UDP-N-acetylglucosamine transferase subunit ALG14 [Palaemon carinicauda]|uniref:UDP-N-acetylglucosamine transferase subunit ALG14 n=1 Tax=Palaemon carinicauda TaxID=392227 RepID=UPI0035B5E564